MKGEVLHDAISLLPEDLLTPVDRLRQQRKTPWKSIAAVAACLCLVVGLWLIYPGNKLAMDSVNSGILNGAGATPEKEPAAEHAHSTTSSGYELEVLRVDEDYAIVLDPPEDPTACIQMSSLMLTYENLEEIPQLQAGQRIRIYYEEDQFDIEAMTVKPYKVEIIEEETK